MAARREAEAAAARAEGAPAGAAAPDALATVRRSYGVVRRVLIGLVLLLGIAWIAAQQRPAAPELAADCAKPAFALSAEKVKQARLVQYTVVGPETKRYALAVGAARFTRNASGGWDPVPLPGWQGRPLVAGGTGPLTGCRLAGQLGLPVPVGEHAVVLYELTDAGSLEVARKTIEVTEHDPD